MLSDAKLHVRVKLSALWVAVMLCYIYGDIFGFFEQTTLVQIVSGTSGVISTQRGLLAAASLMAIPSLMVPLSLLLAASIARWANDALGVIFTLIIVATLPGSWMFYKLLAASDPAPTPDHRLARPSMAKGNSAGCGRTAGQQVRRQGLCP